MILSFHNNVFTLRGVGDEAAALLREMRWTPIHGGEWQTQSVYLAAPFFNSLPVEDVAARQALYPFAWNYGTSFAKEPIPGLPGITLRAGSDAPFPFQVAGGQRAAAQSNIIIGDQPGLGKTLQAIANANAKRPRRWLIGAPAHLVYNWAYEIEMRLAFPSAISILDKARKTVPESGICILPYSRALSFWRGLIAGGPWDMLTLDEFHDLKNHEAQRARPFWGWNDAPGVVAFSRSVVALSGTPQLNNPSELYSAIASMAPWLVHGVNRDKFTNIYCSRHSFGATVQKKSGERVQVTIEKIEEGQFDAALNAELRASGLLVRRAKSEVLTQLPPKRHYLAYLPPDGRVEELIREETTLYEMLQIKDFTAQELMQIKGHVASVRRKLGLLKVPSASQYVYDHFRNGETHVIAFAIHTDVIDGIAHNLERHGIKVYIFDGRRSLKKRDEFMHEFQRSSGRCLSLLQITAAGTGYTLTRACQVVGVERSWVPGRNEQVEDRPHRIGQTRDVEITSLVYQHSVEAKVLRAGARKEKSAERVLDAKIHQMLEQIEMEG